MYIYRVQCEVQSTCVFLDAWKNVEIKMICLARGGGAHLQSQLL
jgi:hypothetical protein